MLSLLHIENIAVIEKADIAFGPGLNVLTGETGAGKSVLIDSINMVLGQRTSRDVVRRGEKKAYVSAMLRGLGQEALFELSQKALEPDEDGVLLLERELSQDGRGVCRVNGRPVTVATLREIAPLLIDIHGQHDSQSLMQSGRHIHFLDAFCGASPILEEYAPLYREMGRIEEELRELLKGEEQKERRIDLLRYQMDEIEKARLSDGEEEELLSLKRVIKYARRIAEALSESFVLLDEGEGEMLPARELLTRAQSSLFDAGRYDKSLAECAERLQNLIYEADDCISTLRARQNELEDFPVSLDEIEERLDIISRMKRKYGGSVASVLSYLENCADELCTLENSEAKIEELNFKLAKQKERLFEIAKRLSEKRRQSARLLETRVMEELSFLDMAKVEFKADIRPITGEEGEPYCGPMGCDEVEFLICTNPGEELKPLGKIVSGGELSRIMLAIKNVLSGEDGVDTLIFDEIDSGVSGRAAARVAKKLREIAREKQVLCVTHLVQIAAAAQRHYLIEKHIENDRAATRVDLIDGEARLSEVARLIGGDNITPLTIKNARELIEHAGAD